MIMSELSFTNCDITHSTKWLRDDLNLDDVIDAFVGLMVGATWPELLVYKCMYERSKEYIDVKNEKEI